MTPSTAEAAEPVAAAETARPRTAARRLRRAVGAAAITVGALVVAFILVGLPLYVFPTVDAVPAQADVVYVIGPPTPARIALARELIETGAADEMLISMPGDALAEGTPSRGRFSACNLPGGDVLCRAPDPATTQGEARLLAETAQEQGWDSAIVITMTPHVSRARMIIDRCFDGELTMRAVSDQPSGLGSWVHQYLYQSAAFVKALAAPGC